MHLPQIAAASPIIEGLKDTARPAPQPAEGTGFLAAFRNTPGDGQTASDTDSSRGRRTEALPGGAGETAAPETPDSAPGQRAAFREIRAAQQAAETSTEQPGPRPGEDGAVETAVPDTPLSGMAKNAATPVSPETRSETSPGNSEPQAAMVLGVPVPTTRPSSAAGVTRDIAHLQARTVTARPEASVRLTPAETAAGVAATAGLSDDAALPRDPQTAPAVAEKAIAASLTGPEADGKAPRTSAGTPAQVQPQTQPQAPTQAHTQRQTQPTYPSMPGAAVSGGEADGGARTLPVEHPRPGLAETATVAGATYPGTTAPRPVGTVGPRQEMQDVDTPAATPSGSISSSAATAPPTPNATGVVREPAAEGAPATPRDPVKPDTTAPQPPRVSTAPTGSDIDTSRMATTGSFGTSGGPDVLSASDPLLSDTLFGESRSATPRAGTSALPILQAPETPRLVALQIAEVVRASGDRAMELRLQPEELGRVQLTMSQDATGTLTVALNVERPETLDLLRRNIDLLSADLRDLGYANIDFSFQGEGSGGEHGPGTGDTPRTIHARSEMLADGLARPSEPARLAAGDGIDIRL